MFSMGGRSVADTTAPTVSNVTATNANGTYGTSDTIHITIQFSEPVIVTGTPKLHLETGSSDHDASYVSGSGTDTLTFDYTPTAGDSSSDLDYIDANSLVLNGGTIQDAAANNANRALANPGAAGSLGANKAIVISTWTNTKALFFDGSNEKAIGTYTAALDWDGTTARTISIWLKIDGSSYRTVYSNINSTGQRGHEMQIFDNGSLRMLMNHSEDINKFMVVRTNDAVPTGQWVMCVISNSGAGTAATSKLWICAAGSVTAYSNALGNIAIDRDTLSGQSITSANPCSFGWREGVGGFYYSGGIDEATVWTRQFSTAEVTELYNAGVPLNPQSHSAASDLIAYWRMGDLDDSITEIKDRIGSAHLTPTNMESGDIQTDVP